MYTYRYYKCTPVCHANKYAGDKTIFGNSLDFLMFSII